MSDKNKLLSQLKDTNDFQSWRINEQQEQIWKLQDEVKELKSQIKRMTMVGDELERVLTSKISSYEVGNASFQWRAAKEGKQP